MGDKPASSRHVEKIFIELWEKKEALLDFIQASHWEVVENVKVWSSYGETDHKMSEFLVLKLGKQNKIQGQEVIIQ